MLIRSEPSGRFRAAAAERTTNLGFQRWYPPMSQYNALSALAAQLSCCRRAPPSPQMPMHTRPKYPTMTCPPIAAPQAPPFLAPSRAHPGSSSSCTPFRHTATIARTSQYMPGSIVRKVRGRLTWSSSGKQQKESITLLFERQLGDTQAILR